MQNKLKTKTLPGTGQLIKMNNPIVRNGTKILGGELCDMNHKQLGKLLTLFIIEAASNALNDLLNQF